MKYNNLYNKIAGVALASLAVVACSDDWNEHYDAQLQTGVNSTLWQTISGNENLSNFAEVIQTCGYDKNLNSEQVFTVFAPTNEYFTEAEKAALIKQYNEEKAANTKDKDNSTIKQFVQNHIALYNYSAANGREDTLTMLNGKYLVLNEQTAGGQKIRSGNQLHNNGILYIIEGITPYNHNVFEKLGAIEGLDSIANFLYSYNKYEFIPELSVPGGIENGQTIYLDSVMQLQNEMFSYLGRINSEDSTYWMLAPNNDEWNRLIEEYTPYFYYHTGVEKRDSLNFTLARMAILQGSVFSRTINPDEAIQDSIRSTNAVSYAYRERAYGSSELAYYEYKNPFDEGRPFYGAEEIAASNGSVWKANTWNIDKKETFYQTVIIEAEDISSSLKEVDEKTTNPNPTVVTVPRKNPFYNQISGNSYIEIYPQGSPNTTTTFYIPNVLSNLEYDLYLITAPGTANVEDTALVAPINRLPNKLRLTLGWYKEDGTEDSKRVISEIEASSIKPDTILVQSGVKFPTCSIGMTTPQVTLSINTRVSNREVNAGSYNRTLRVDCIILKPHEESESN